MKNSQLIVSTAAVFVAFLLTQGEAHAQDASKVYRVGLLTPGLPGAGLLGPELVQDFVRRGYVLDKTIAFVPRSAQGNVARLPALVDELVASHVDGIITASYPAAIAAKEHAGGIPIVVTQSGDPVATQLVDSLARPGGNITGVSEIAAELSAKRLQLLKEAVPSVHSVAVLWNADDLGMTLRYRAAEEEAPKLGMVIVPLGVHAPDDFDTAFSEMTKTPPDAILMVTDVLTNLNRKRVIDFAAAHHMPTIFEYDALAHDGGLLAYGPNVSDIKDRAAGLADRILHGAKLADLPLELPTRFQYAINLKTAKALGITISESAQLRADDIIE
jgi:putative tryptophan/tyrosine transport system substrate-binding protein